MISVVIPLYNASEYICDAVSSVFMQDTDLELIVVEDCSKDDSLRVLLDFLENMKIKENETKKETICSFDNLDFAIQDLRLIYRQQIGGSMVLVVQNSANKGVAHSRNAGVRIASGKYIAFLDADDRWTEDKLKRQLKLIEEKNAPLVCTSRALMSNDGELTGKIIHSPEYIDLRLLKKSNYVNCSSVLVRREIIKKIEMEHSEAHEDYLCWLRICEGYGPFYCIDEPLLEYRLSKGGKSRNKLKSALMNYRTYVLAGYGRIKSCFMMAAYMINGLKKYK